MQVPTINNQNYLINHAEIKMENKDFAQQRKLNFILKSEIKKVIKATKEKKLFLLDKYGVLRII